MDNYASPHPALLMDGVPFNSSAIMDVLRLNRHMPMIVKELLLNHTLKDIKLEEEFECKLLNDFRIENNLASDESFISFLSSNYLNEALLKQDLYRPYRVVRYREERWGPRANSLYLENKDRYDLITYRRLQSTNPDVMQEVFFRLKDKEESWESMASQFPGAPPNANAQHGPLPVSKVEAPLLEVLRKAGPGNVARPIQINNQIVVSELESLQPCRFDDELRSLILREEFDKWLEEECKKMLNHLELPS